MPPHTAQTIYHDLDGNEYVKTGEYRIPKAGEYLLGKDDFVYGPAGRSGVGEWVSPRVILKPLVPSEYPAVFSDQDAKIRRVTEQPVDPPVKRWDIEKSNSGEVGATVGFGKRDGTGVPGIRIEIDEMYAVAKHKGRNVPAGCMNVKTARRLAQAIIEACDAAADGRHVFTKRS